MSDSLIWYSAAVVAISAVVTWLTRALPFLIFGQRKLPQVVRYLGAVLPPAIMMILVCYCLKGTGFTAYPYGLPELLSCLGVFILYKWKHNMYLAIVAGTILFMVLSRAVFVI